MLQSTDYSQKLRELDFLDSTRKSLVRLAIIRAKTLTQGTQKKISEKDSEAENAGTDVVDFQKKALDYERRFAALKSQLATKDQVHEAKIDGFKQLIARLQSQLETQSQVEPNKKGSKNFVTFPSSPSSSGKFGNSSFFSPARTASVFNFPSPFAEKSGKGNSFSVSGINSSIASQASLKLSRGKQRDEEVFSPNNSSAEGTPRKSQSGNNFSLEDSRPGNLSQELRRLSEKTDKTAENTENSNLRPNGIDKETDNSQAIDNSKPADIYAESSNLDLSIRLDHAEGDSDENLKQKDVTSSEPDDTFLSANGTFDQDVKKGIKNGAKNGKKRIRLFSSEASKILVESQSKLNEEEADPNSLNYYEDDNFKDDLVSPTRPLKRSLKEEKTDKTTKKRHVFKI